MKRILAVRTVAGTGIAVIINLQFFGLWVTINDIKKKESLPFSAGFFVYCFVID